MPPDPREVLAEDWLERARRDLLLARLALGDANLSGLAAFHGQQAAEKALKAYLARQDQPALRTHDLPALLARCVRFDGEFARIAEAARILDDYLTPGAIPTQGPILRRPKQAWLWSSRRPSWASSAADSSARGRREVRPADRPG
jgi:HEPN domain-containing protein